MGKVKIDTTKKGATVEISGYATVEHAENIKKSLSKILELKKPVSLSLKKIQKADISFFQILIALEKEITKEDPGLSLKLIDAPPSIGETINILGLSHSKEISRIFTLS